MGVLICGMLTGGKLLSVISIHDVWNFGIVIAWRSRLVYPTLKLPALGEAAFTSLVLNSPVVVAGVSAARFERARVIGSISVAESGVALSRVPEAGVEPAGVEQAEVSLARVQQTDFVRTRVQAHADLVVACRLRAGARYESKNYRPHA